PTDAPPARHPLDWVARTGASEVLLQELQTRRQRRSRRRRRAAGAGSIAALLVVAGLLWPDAEREPGGVNAPASSTVVTVPARQVLPDGSVVELEDGAKIAVGYGERIRSVVLKQGKAHFQVAKNDAVPFVVTVGGVEIRAVGTAFSVHAAAAAIEVLVTEGQVAVSSERPEQRPAAETTNARRGSGGDEAVVVSAGHRMVLDAAPKPGALADPRVTPVSPDEMEERLAWRVPRIEFSGTPLAEAIPVFNRHSRVRVRVGDPALDRLQLSGILRADNVDALVRLLEANYGVTADRRENEIVLRKVFAAQKPK
ncbi:MAG: FecR family protein, partial [Opitutaceae bacterium]